MTSPAVSTGALATALIVTRCPTWGVLSDALIPTVQLIGGSDVVGGVVDNPGVASGWVGVADPGVCAVELLGAAPIGPNVADGEGSSRPPMKESAA